MAEAIQIPAAELRFTFARSSGPGGQNVNKVNSKAILHWNVEQSTLLPEAARRRFKVKNSGKMTQDGDVVVMSQRFRDQPRNIADCVQKLQELLRIALIPPVPRRPTKPTRASGERRLRDKKSQARRKQGRRRPPDQD